MTQKRIVGVQMINPLRLIRKVVGLMLVSLMFSACSVIAVVDTAVDVALLPVKVGVAVVEAAIPDED